jgi:hypothetical protein
MRARQFHDEWRDRLDKWKDNYKDKQEGSRQKGKKKAKQRWRNLLKIVGRYLGSMSQIVLSAS